MKKYEKPDMKIFTASLIKQYRNYDLLKEENGICGMVTCFGNGGIQVCPENEKVNLFLKKIGKKGLK